MITCKVKREPKSYVVSELDNGVKERFDIDVKLESDGDEEYENDENPGWTVQDENTTSLDVELKCESMNNIRSPSYKETDFTADILDSRGLHEGYNTRDHQHICRNNDRSMNCGDTNRIEFFSHETCSVPIPGISGLDGSEQSDELYETETFERGLLGENLQSDYIGLNPYACETCKFRTNTKYNLRRHIESLHLGIKLFSCGFCNYQTRRSCNLEAHLNVHPFVRPVTLSENNDSVRSTNLQKHKPFACHICKYTSRDQQQLKIHVQRKHEGVRPFQCEFCEYKANYKVHLNRHVKTIHCNLKPYVCHICKFRSSHMYHVKSHIKNVHLDMKPYACTLCHYRAFRKVYLDNHVKAIHLRIKSYVCQWCHYSAVRKDYLYNHVRRVHAERQEDNIADLQMGSNQYKEMSTRVLKPYACSGCSYRACYKAHLKLHIQSVHLGMRPFACKFCDYKATRNNHLNKHVQTVHRKLRPFVCPICDYKSGQEGTLRSHIQNIHLNK